MKLKSIVETAEFDVEVPVEFQPLYTERDGKMMLTEVEGIRTEADITRLQKALKLERDAHKATKEIIAPLKDHGDIDTVLAQLARIPELEASQGNIDEAKLQALLEPRVAAKLNPILREKTELTKSLEAVTAELTTYKTREVKGSIRSKVAAEAKDMVRDTALDDVLLYAEMYFERNEDGAVVTKEGIDGLEAGLDAKGWLNLMLPKRPHWLKDSDGLGVRGGKGAQGGSNPFAHDTWNMTEQGRIYKENPERAAKLAKAAGTSIGGPKPAKK